MGLTKLLLSWQSVGAADEDTDGPEEGKIDGFMVGLLVGRGPLVGALVGAKVLGLVSSLEEEESKSYGWII